MLCNALGGFNTNISVPSCMGSSAMSAKLPAETEVQHDQVGVQKRRGAHGLLGYREKGDYSERKRCCAQRRNPCCPGCLGTAPLPGSQVTHGRPVHLYTRM